MNYEALKRFEEEVPPLPVKFMPFYMFGVSGPQSLNDKIFNAECEVIKKNWLKMVVVLFLVVVQIMY